MKPVAVHDQVRLSWGRCMYLTLAGMYYRLTRSTITVAIVSLAVAFLSYMLVYSVCVQERAASAHQELRKSRALGEWVARMSAPDALPAIVDAVVAGDSGRIREYRGWSGMDGAEIDSSVLPAVMRYRQFLRFFNTMRPASRAVLLGDADAYRLPDQLASPGYIPLFVRQIGELGLKVPLASEAALRDFATVDWPAVLLFVTAVRDGQQRSVDAISRAAGPSGILVWIATQPDSVLALCRRLGYEDPATDVATLKQQAIWSQQERAFTRLIALPDIRSAVARLLDIDRKGVTMTAVCQWMTTEERAAEMHAVVAAGDGGSDVPPAATLAQLARQDRRAAQLQQAAGTEPPSSRRGLAGVPQATRWLVIVSFLVCAVGICNTMFMSVTERFTEIATMKCLGAMDGFVMLMFVFEASIQGLAGSAVGLIVGILLAFARGAAGFGPMFFESIPWSAFGMVAGGAMVVGVALAALSAVGPAWMAARLAPMEAMRVE